VGPPAAGAARGAPGAAHAAAERRLPWGPLRHCAWGRPEEAQWVAQCLLWGGPSAGPATLTITALPLASLRVSQRQALGRLPLRLAAPRPSSNC